MQLPNPANFLISTTRLVSKKSTTRRGRQDHEEQVEGQERQETERGASGSLAEIRAGLSVGGITVGAFHRFGGGHGFSVGGERWAPGGSIGEAVGEDLQFLRTCPTLDFVRSGWP